MTIFTSFIAYVHGAVPPDNNVFMCTHYTEYVIYHMENLHKYFTTCNNMFY